MDGAKNPQDNAKRLLDRALNHAIRAGETLDQLADASSRNDRRRLEAQARLEADVVAAQTNVGRALLDAANVEDDYAEAYKHGMAEGIQRGRVRTLNRTLRELEDLLEDDTATEEDLDAYLDELKIREDDVADHADDLAVYRPTGGLEEVDP